MIVPVRSFAGMPLAALALAIATGMCAAETGVIVQPTAGRDLGPAEPGNPAAALCTRTVAGVLRAQSSIGCPPSGAGLQPRA